MHVFHRFARTLLLTGMLAAVSAASALAGDLVVTIDPGHGGSDAGSTAVYSGKTVQEKTCNLDIAKALKTELETYRNVKVYLTRSSDTTLSLEARVNAADSHDSDLLISIHNNARGDAQPYTSGSSALVSSGQYYRDLANCTSALGKTILSELHSGPGTTNRGLLKRLSGSSYYPNGARADYYGLIRYGTNDGIPTMIVEHSFIDNRSDYTAFLSTAAKRKQLGIADATAIAKYYGLDKKDGSVNYTASGVPVRMISRHWMLKGGKYYYVRNNGTYKTGWQTLGSHTYHFASSGAASTGLHTYTSSPAGTYYFNSRGQMVTGWVQLDGDWYYFRKTGKALKDTTRVLKGKSYTFDRSGVCTNYPGE